MSNYPSALDDDISIPRVDSNITDLGPDAINALRSAMFAVEQTLGISPQGSTSSIASFLSVSFNLDGTIKPSVLASAGLVYLPIVDSEISPTAAIQESKLALTYSTSSLYNLFTSLNNAVEILNGFLSLTGVKVEPHIAGTNYNHELSAILVDNSLPMLKTNPQPLFQTPGTNTINRNTTNADTLIKDISDDLLTHEKANGNPNNTSTSGGTIAPQNFAHVSTGLYLDPANFSTIPQTVDTVQSFAEYVDSSSLLLLGSRVQTLFASGIPRSSRSESLTQDGYGYSIIGPTPAIAYLLDVPPGPISSTPIDDINAGDDVILLQPTSGQLANYIFDSQFALVKTGDIITINYNNGTGLSYQFIIDSVKAAISGGTRVYEVRINGKNLFSSSNAVVAINASLANRAKYGVLATSIAPNNINDYESLIISNPRSAVALGNDFDDSVFDSAHYNLYLVVYPHGNTSDTSSLLQLPAIDVTGNKGTTPDLYTIDYIIQQTNTAFRQPGFNFRFVAFKYNGQFGVMMADPYNNASFSIIGGSGVDGTGTYNYGSGSSNATATHCPNNVIDNVAGIDPLGLGLSGSGIASPPPFPIFTYTTAISANIAPLQVFYPLAKNYFYTNGAERDRLRSDPNFFNQIVDQYGDGYWPGTIISVTNFSNRVQTSYQINLDLASTGLRIGKTIIIQPAFALTDSRYNYRDYGRFIINNVQFFNCNTANAYTVITVYDAVYGVGISPTTTSNNIPVNIYFSDDSVSFDKENVFDENSGNYPYRRYFEILVDQNGHSFSHERARFQFSGANPTSLIEFVSVSPKLRGYPTNNDISIRFVISNYDQVSGLFKGQLGRWNPSSSTFTNGGPLVQGKVGEIVRFYDETNIDYIDFTSNLQSNNIRNGNIDIQLFSSLQLDDELMLVSSCMVDDSTTSITILNDNRQFGNVSEQQLSTSALDYISASDKLLRENGVIKGFELNNPTPILIGSAATITSVVGGTVTFTDSSVNMSTLHAGQYINVSGANTSANNGTFLIASSSTHSVTFVNINGDSSDVNNGFIPWSVISSSSISINGGTALVNGKIVNVNNVITEIPIVYDYLPSISSAIPTITWFLCVNDQGQFVFIPSTDFDPAGPYVIQYTNAFVDHNRIFVAQNPNSTSIYNVRGTYFANLVLNYTDLTPLYIITSTVGLNNGSTPYTINNYSINDARRFVSGGFNGLNNFVLGPNSNFRSFQSMNSWLQQLTRYISSYYNVYEGPTFTSSTETNLTVSQNLGINVIVKGTWQINQAISLDYRTPVTFNGDNAIFVFQAQHTNVMGSLQLGNNISFRNITFDQPYDARSDSNYDSTVLSNNDNACIVMNVKTANENINIDNCTFTYNNPISTSTIIRFPYILVNFLGSSPVLQNLKITNNNFVTTSFTGANDKLSVITIRVPAGSGSPVKATLINSQISNNVCNQDQLILLSSGYRGTRFTTSVNVQDYITAKNVKIINNICGAIGHLTGEDPTPYPTDNYLYNLSKDNGLSISDNACRFIYFGLADGTIGQTISSIFSRASQMINLSNGIGSVSICRNTCSWIHTCSSTATSSNLFVCDNRLAAFDPNFLVGYYDLIANVPNIALIIDLAANNPGGGGGA